MHAINFIADIHLTMQLQTKLNKTEITVLTVNPLGKYKNKQFNKYVVMTV